MEIKDDLVGTLVRLPRRPASQNSNDDIGRVYLFGAPARPEPAYYQHHYDEAIDLYAKAHALDPNFVPVPFLIGQIHIQPSSLKKEAR